MYNYYGAGISQRYFEAKTNICLSATDEPGYLVLNN